MSAVALVPLKLVSNMLKSVRLTTPSLLRSASVGVAAELLNINITPTVANTQPAINAGREKSCRYRQVLEAESVLFTYASVYHLGTGLSLIKLLVFNCHPVVRLAHQLGFVTFVG